MGKNAENIEVFTQNSIRIKGSIGNVYVDTFKMAEEPHDADYVFITHDHYDHFNIEDLPKVCKPDTVLIVPENMKEKAKEAASFVKKIETVRAGEKRTIGGITFETVLSYNIGKPFHPKDAGWVGYILIVDGERIYVAGDTDATDEAKKVKCDVALVPIGGKYTMDAEEAAGLINVIKPTIAIPTHFGGIVGSSSDADIFAKSVMGPVKVIRKI